jgi:hypothetical protein
MHAMQAIYRQGDVLFIRIEAMPEEDLTPKGDNVIVEGETTGHAHRLTVGQILVDTKTTMYLACQTMSQVVHEEHLTIDLPPGLYRVQRQREYVAPDISRMVID